MAASTAARIDAEMRAFLAWFDDPLSIDGVLHAAIAHLWFVTIRPFEDGNGRVARALADMSLARSEHSPRRFYSLSSQIRRDRASYYGSLERTQRDDLDITARLLWFVQCLSGSLDAAELACASVLREAELWHRHALVPLNERQRSTLNRLFDGFEGNLTARKWATLAGRSLPTAQRDPKELSDQGVLIRNEGGSKNTSYGLAAR